MGWSVPYVMKGVSPCPSGHTLSSAENPTLLIQHPVAGGILFIYSFSFDCSQLCLMFIQKDWTRGMLEREGKTNASLQKLQVSGSRKCSGYETWGGVGSCGLWQGDVRHGKQPVLRGDGKNFPGSRGTGQHLALLRKGSGYLQPNLTQGRRAVKEETWLFLFFFFFVFFSHTEFSLLGSYFF